MNIAVYSAHAFEKQYLEDANKGRFQLRFIEKSLSFETAHLSQNCEAVSIFVGDNGSSVVLELLAKQGVRYLLLRSAGYNHVDIEAAKKLNIKTARVPEYSPYAIAEHCVALMMALNRKLVQAHNRIMDQNFSLDGLVGFDMHGKTVGILGTGKIGHVVAAILHGFGCRILAYDVMENEELKSRYQVKYVSLSTLYQESDILTLHLPFLPETRHIINKSSIDEMKNGVMLINTSRGGLVNTVDLINGLKTGRIGFAGIDVYEEEAGLFFEDHSGEILTDDVFARLMLFPNVLITSHQAFLTNTALQNIAETTMENLAFFQKGVKCGNEI